jgi:transposase
MNSAIDVCLEWLNNRQMRHLKKSRRELLLEIDLPALKPLPGKAYEYADWKDARVNIDYHVTFDGHHYSVPHQLVHELTNVRATSTAIEIFRRGQRVASHVRSYSKNIATTITAHMPRSHQEHAEWTPSRIINWSANLGEAVGLLVKKIIEQRAHPEQGFRSALGIIRLEKKYGKERLNAACQRAVELGVLRYSFVNEMLKNKMDFANRKTDTSPMPASFDPITSEEQLSLLGEENIRGSGYYH